MLSKILSLIAAFILGFIKKGGYVGIFLLMALESCNIPIPSEIIMPFSGFLATQKVFNLFMLALIGGLGNLFGSLISYLIAFKLKDKIKNFFIRSKFFSHDYLTAEKFFVKYGVKSIFIGRLLPIIRTFISFPAGSFAVNLKKFIFYTFIGAFFWSYFLAYLGYYLGEHWDILGQYFQKFDYLIIGLFVLFVFYYIIRKVKEIKKSNVE